MATLFGNRRIRPITPLDVAPAEHPDADKKAEAELGRVRLDHSVARAERTVAQLAEQYADQAAHGIFGR